MSALEKHENREGQEIPQKIPSENGTGWIGRKKPRQIVNQNDIFAFLFREPLFFTPTMHVVWILFREGIKPSLKHTKVPVNSNFFLKNQKS